MFIFNYVTDLSSSNTRTLSSLTPSLQTANNIVDVNVVTLITNEYAVAALWDAPSFQTLTSASGTITTIGSFQADDIFYCVVEDDCIVACKFILNGSSVANCTSYPFISHIPLLVSVYSSTPLIQGDFSEKILKLKFEGLSYATLL